MNDELIEKYNDELEEYFYDNYNCSNCNEQKLKQGLDNILCEIFEYAEDDTTFQDLKERVEVSCSEYDFPENLRENYGECPHCGYELTLESSDYAKEDGEDYKYTRKMLLKYHFEASPECNDKIKT